MTKCNATGIDGASAPDRKFKYLHTVQKTCREALVSVHAAVPLDAVSQRVKVTANITRKNNLLSVVSMYERAFVLLSEAT